MVSVMSKEHQLDRNTELIRFGIEIPGSGAKLEGIVAGTVESCPCRECADRKGGDLGQGSSRFVKGQRRQATVQRPAPPLPEIVARPDDYDAIARVVQHVRGEVVRGPAFLDQGPPSGVRCDVPAVGLLRGGSGWREEQSALCRSEHAG